MYVERLTLLILLLKNIYIYIHKHIDGSVCRVQFVFSKKIVLTSWESMGMEYI